MTINAYEYTYYDMLFFLIKFLRQEPEEHPLKKKTKKNKKSRSTRHFVLESFKQIKLVEKIFFSRCTGQANKN